MSAITNAKGSILERVKTDSNPMYPERSHKIRGPSEPDTTTLTRSTAACGVSKRFAIQPRIPPLLRECPNTGHGQTAPKHPTLRVTQLGTTA